MAKLPVTSFLQCGPEQLSEIFFYPWKIVPITAILHLETDVRKLRCKKNLFVPLALVGCGQRTAEVKLL